MHNRFRLVIAGLLLAINMINYMDRAAMGLLAPQVSHSLHLSKSEMGLVFSVFFASYACFAFLGGYFSDRFGPRRTFGYAVLFWSVFCGATGAAYGFMALLIIRLFFGGAEGPMNSTTNRMVANWFPRKETARAVGFAHSGQSLGSAIAAPLVIGLSYAIGWRPTFLVLGAIGLVWAIIWARIATDRPEQSGHVTQAEATYIKADRPVATPTGPTRLSRRDLLRADIICIALCFFSLLYPLYIFVSWLPTYLTGTLHLHGVSLSIAAAIPWIGAMIGYNLGGLIADQVFRQMADGLSARKITTLAPMVLCFLALACLPSVSRPIPAIVLITVALTTLAMATQSLWALIHEVSPPDKLGSVSGFAHFVANSAGVIAPALTGYVAQQSGSFSSGFYLCVVIGLLGALFLYFGAGSGRQTPTALTSHSS